MSSARQVATGSPDRAEHANDAVTANFLALAQEFQDAIVVQDPITATANNFQRTPESDRRMPNPTVGANNAFVRRIGALKRRLLQIDMNHLPAAHVQTYTALLAECEYAEFLGTTQIFRWDVNTMWDLHHNLQFLGSAAHAVSNRGDVDSLIDRYRQVPLMFQRKMNNVRRAARSTPRRVMPRVTIEKVIEQIDDLIAHSETFAGVLETQPAGMSTSDWERAKADLNASIARDVVPTLQRYRAFLASTPTRETVGLSALPGGDAVYQAYARFHGGSARTPDEIHQIGIDQVAKYEEKMVPLAYRLLGGAHRYRRPGAAFRAVGRQPEERVPSDELLGMARAATERGLKKLGPELGVRPGEVEARPWDIQGLDVGGDGASAQFVPGAIDANGKQIRKGTTRVDLKAPPPAGEVPDLMVHEAVAHYLQFVFTADPNLHPVITLASGPSTIIEGGALHTEIFAGDQKFFRTEREQFGNYSEVSFRAVRLVVDTGLHAKGWSRARAIRYMMDHTSMSRRAAAREVDRYIAFPGQALAYMSGALGIQELREQFEARMGDRFDLGGFHRIVLGAGWATLDGLRTCLTRWATEKQSAAH